MLCYFGHIVRGWCNGLNLGQFIMQRKVEGKRKRREAQRMDSLTRWSLLSQKSMQCWMRSIVRHGITSLKPLAVRHVRKGPTITTIKTNQPTNHSQLIASDDTVLIIPCDSSCWHYAIIIADVMMLYNSTWYVVVLSTDDGRVANDINIISSYFLCAIYIR